VTKTNTRSFDKKDGKILKSRFIGSTRITLYQQYSREDVGYKGTQISCMKTNDNKNEKVLFVNLGDKYDNRITKNGLIHEPRLPNHLLSKHQTIPHYLFIRFGNRGNYYYVGVSYLQKRHNNNHNLLEFVTSGIPADVIKALGGFQPLP